MLTNKAVLPNRCTDACCQGQQHRNHHLHPRRSVRRRKSLYRQHLLRQ